MKPFRHVRLGSRGNAVQRFPDGTMILSSPEKLRPYRTRYTEPLEHWAKSAPDRVFLGERNAHGAWRTLTYGEAYSAVQNIAQALLDRKLPSDRPVMILSGNDIEHALLALAAMHVGIPYAAISVGFSLLSSDHAKLRHTFDLLTPGLVFAASGTQFQRAIEAVVSPEVEVVVAKDAAPGRPMTMFDLLSARSSTPEVAERASLVTGDTVAKVLFTSGSSAMPKGVINTNRMLCANQQMCAQVWPFLTEEPPVFVDWLPWNHTFGGNYVFGLALFNGGSLYIDEGRPLPNEVAKTVANIRDIQPTAYFSVPKGFEMLLPHLDQDSNFRSAFFSRMKMILYAGASLPASLWEDLRTHAVNTVGERIFTTASYGSTETAPVALTPNWDIEEPGIIGLPAPGVELKLVPNGRKMEVRVRGHNVTPGYWRQPELSKKAFDSDGWYCMGDAVRFADPTDVDRGLIYDGRVAEDFKLSTGTWVNVGPLRAMLNSCLSPLARDVCITGHDRGEIGVLVFPELEICRELAGLGPDASADEVMRSESVRQEFQTRLEKASATATASSTRVARAILLSEPLTSIEVTDKAMLSVNVVLERRSADIRELYEQHDSPRVLRLS